MCTHRVFVKFVWWEVDFSDVETHSHQTREKASKVLIDRGDLKRCANCRSQF